jgi:hypothetical protein
MGGLVSTQQVGEVGGTAVKGAAQALQHTMHHMIKR